ncbi:MULTISPECIES: hypothetical protein [unclassified Luteimonas]
MNPKYLLVAPLALVLALSGCGRTDAPTTGAATAPAAESASQAQPAAKAGRETLAIGDGVVLPGGFSMRSRSTSGEGADASHVARAEFRGAPAEAGNALRKVLVEAGYQQASATEDADGIATRIFRSGDGERVRVVLIPKGPALQVELQDANAGGLATFYWRDGASSN